MKHARLIGLYLGCAWGAFILVRSTMVPTSKIVGEGEFILLIATVPLLMIAMLDSLFISIPSRIPAYYAGAVAALAVGLFLVYRVHLGFTSDDVVPTLLTAVIAAAIFLACIIAFYLVPGLKWLFHRVSTKNA